MRPRADLIAYRTQRVFSDAGGGATNGLQEIHLLLDAGLDAAVGAVVSQIPYRILELVHERVEVRVLVGERPQVAYEARKYPGHSRTQNARTPQVVAQIEFVNEPESRLK